MKYVFLCHKIELAKCATQHGIMATYINLTHEVDTIELHLLSKFNSQNALMEFHLNNVLPQKLPAIWHMQWIPSIVQRNIIYLARKCQDA